MLFEKLEMELLADPAEVWPLISDTNALNQKLGLPMVEVVEESDQGRRVRTRIRGLMIECWEQSEWRPYQYEIRRQYLNGPMLDLRVRARLERNQHGNSQFSYEIWYTPRNWFWKLIVRREVRATLKKIRVLLSDSFCRDADDPPQNLLHSPPTLTARGFDLLGNLRRELLQQANPRYVEALFNAVSQLGEIEAGKIRPFALADRGGLDRRGLLETCLKAVRLGLLDLRLDQICPHCRGAKQTVERFRELKGTAHCDSCNVTFKMDSVESLEVTFRPSASIRKTSSGQYCLAGPAAASHILINQRLEPGERRAIALALEPGRYRLRVHRRPAAGWLIGIQFNHRSAARVEIKLSDLLKSESREAEVSPDSGLLIINDTDSPHSLMVEDLSWSDQAASAGQVISLQIFRDLFVEESLAPDVHFEIGNVAILFTDLKDSTRKYEQEGDGPAFGMVRQHFELLRPVIKEHHGRIVKTIGDAIMAAFCDPREAIVAAVAAHTRMHNHLPGVTLKIGIHWGRCIAVQSLDGQVGIDYFGRTVNKAARVQGQSQGGDIVLSADLAEHPEAARLLGGSFNQKLGLDKQPFQADLKGIGLTDLVRLTVRPL